MRCLLEGAHVDGNMQRGERSPSWVDPTTALRYWDMGLGGWDNKTPLMAATQSGNHRLVVVGGHALTAAMIVGVVVLPL
jgi:hypothetical protein